MPKTNIEEIVKEKVAKFRREFLRENGGDIEDSFKDPNGDAGYVVIWLRQALLSIAQESRISALMEAEEALSHSAHPYCECNNGKNAYDLFLHLTKKKE